jgi:Swi5-dependent recombination DNA repair protein 1
MPCPPPPLKRRRLNPSSTLSKPFKSPLKTPPAASPSTPTPPTPPPPTSLPPAKATSPRQPLSTTKSTPSPTLLSLRRQHVTLLSTLAAARATLDTATQALKLETSDTDAELEALVRKWRGASREAAEEVYRDVRERVNRMGGVRGWRAREKERRQGMLDFQRDWEGEGKDEGGGGGGERSGERDGDEDNEEEGGKEEGEEEVGNEDEVRCAFAYELAASVSCGDGDANCWAYARGSRWT